MTDLWDPTGAGVLRLPSGRLVRGRSLRQPLPSGPRSTFAVYLLGKTPPAVAWESRWLRWSDHWLPSDQEHARTVLHEAWESTLTQRVEIACRGGRGRTGTALACLTIIDGVPEDVHATNAGALLDPSVSFFSYRRGGVLLAVGALKRIDNDHAELKSMHTALLARGQGIGRVMLAHLLAVARELGFRRVRLETGSTSAFAPARVLYASAGFTTCGRFGDYRPSRYCTFMTLDVGARASQPQRDRR